jgi:glycosyltransferase involved in cell wall biosynthesis
VSIPGWEPILRKLAFSDRRRRFVWAPIPSNVLTSVDSAEVGQRRSRLLVDTNGWLVGHFGTYADGIKKLLTAALQQLLSHEARPYVVLLGYGGPAFANELTAAMPTAANRIIAPGPLSADEVAVHLAACDVLLQPYHDGISTRRTSAMAGLALGRPMVTTSGHNTEPFWLSSPAIAMGPGNQLGATVQRLLDDPDRRAEMGRCARALYHERFSLEHTIRLLRGDLTTSNRFSSYPVLETAS